MSKMHYFNDKFLKIFKRWRFLDFSTRKTFHIGDLKFRDLAKVWFFKLIMIKSKSKKQLWHYQLYVTKITSQFFPILASPNKISGYTSDW